MAYIFPQVQRESPLTQWLGFYSGGALWQALRTHLLIIILLQFQRQAYWWAVRPFNLKDTADTHVNLDDILVDQGAFPISEHRPPSALVPRIKWYLDNFYSVYGVEVLFLVLCISLTFRINVMGIFILLTLLIAFNCSEKNKEKGLVVLVVFFAYMILAQYFLIVGLPLADPHPWLRGPELLLLWLLIINPSPYVLLVDFAVMYFTVCLIHAKPIAHPLPKNFLDFDHQGFTQPPRTWYAQVRFIIVKYSAYIVLVCIFLAGAGGSDLLSFIYVAFALLMLFAGNRYTQSWNKMWSAAHIYSAVVVLLFIVWQIFGYIAAARSQLDVLNQVGSIFGLSVTSQNDVLSSSRHCINDVIVFALLTLQKQIFGSADFRVVNAYVKQKRGLALDSAREFFKKKKEKYLEEREEVEREQHLRWARLQIVKEQRARAHHRLVPTDPFPEISFAGASTPSVSTPSSIPGTPTRKKQKPRVTIQEQKKQEEVPFKEKLIANLKAVRDFIKKWALIALEKFIDWIDQEGKEEAEKYRKAESEKKKEKEKEKERRDSISNNNNEAGKSNTPPDAEIGSSTQLSDPASSNMMAADAPRTMWRRFVRGFIIKIHEDTKTICFAAFILNALVNANVLSLAYPFAVFCYARMQDDPQPGKGFWRIMLGYSAGVILLKFFFQITLFCMCNSGGNLTIHLLTCDESCGKQMPYAEQLLSVPYLDCCVLQPPFNKYILALMILIYVLGIYQTAFMSGAFCDLLVFLLILWHRHSMRTKGLWDYTEEDVQSQPRKGIQEESEKNFMDTEISLGEEVLTPADEGVASTLSFSTVSTDQVVSEASPRVRTQAALELIQEHEAEGMHGVYPSELPETLAAMDGENEKYYDDGIPDDEIDEEGNYIDDEQSGVMGKIRATLRSIHAKVEPAISLFKKGYEQVLATDKTGRDYYTYIFLIDFICFVFLIIFQQDFTGIATDSIALFFDQSVIPRQYVGLLLAQFALIILDRVVYLFRSVVIKLVMQIVLTVIYHLLLFFILPSSNSHPFLLTWSFIVFYLLKCAYLYISALQICYGYTQYVDQHLFMDSYSDFNSTIFSVYRAIPFVFELSTILEWIAADTTMLFYDWLKCEDIYAQLYQVKCRNEWIKRQGRPRGTKQPALEKCTTGVLLFLVLVFVIWFPLIVLSSGLPGAATSPVTSLSISVGVTGWDPFYQINQDVSYKDTAVNDSTFQALAQNSFILADEQPNTQLLSMPLASESLWAISPPSRTSLLASLASSPTTFVYVQYTLSRPGTLNNVLTGSGGAALPPESVAQLIQVLNENSTSATVTIPNIFYRYLRLPGVSGSPAPQGAQVTCQLRLQQKIKVYNITQGGNLLSIPSVEEWWELQQINNPNEIAAREFNSTGLQVVSISAQLPTGLASTLVSAGIIGLCIDVGVVLSVGRFLRMIVTGLTMRIIVENLPNCDELIQMCKDLFIARQYGDLLVEEELYWELIQIFRSPEALIDKTKAKQD